MTYLILLIAKSCYSLEGNTLEGERGRKGVKESERKGGKEREGGSTLRRTVNNEGEMLHNLKGKKSVSDSTRLITI